MKTVILPLLLASTALMQPAGSAAASPPPPMVLETAAAASSDDQPPVTFAIEITAEQQRLWAGSLRVGGKYGSSSFSQSKQEYEESCSGISTTGRSSSNLHLNLGRYGGQNREDRFTVNMTWTRPLSPCDGGGTATVGFNRVVVITAGQTVRLEGDGGLQVKVTRAR